MPLFAPVLDDCNKRNLESYYKNQREHYQMQQVAAQRTQDWIEASSKELKDSAKQHEEKMARIDRLIYIFEQADKWRSRGFQPRVSPNDLPK